MLLFRIWLATILIIISGYTGVVIATQGWNLFPVFFGDIAAMRWPGQFNLDFMFMLSLSALWVAWRNRFTPIAWLLALLAFNFGAPFLAIYLLVLSVRTRGDLAVMLCGEPRT